MNKRDLDPSLTWRSHSCRESCRPWWSRKCRSRRDAPGSRSTWGSQCASSGPWRAEESGHWSYHYIPHTACRYRGLLQMLMMRMKETGHCHYYYCCYYCCCLLHSPDSRWTDQVSLSRAAAVNQRKTRQVSCRLLTTLETYMLTSLRDARCWHERVKHDPAYSVLRTEAG